ncbi:MAG: hypothetical protein O7G29_13885 [Acidobacteria bacterium]|nr:hypothetical protein [Acidobacteriota bacterium]
MDPWQKDTLGLQVGDTIIWQGEVISLHDGFHLDVAEVAPIPPKAIVLFESGMALAVDQRMKWEHLLESKL